MKGILLIAVSIFQVFFTSSFNYNNSQFQSKKDKEEIKLIRIQEKKTVQKRLLAVVTVQGKPLPGQSWRESNNFAINTNSRLYYNIRSQFTNPQYITVDMRLDIKWNKDRTIFTNIFNGSSTPGLNSRNLYFGNSMGTNRPFIVEIYSD